MPIMKGCACELDAAGEVRSMCELHLRAAARKYADSVKIDALRREHGEMSRLLHRIASDVENWKR